MADTESKSTQPAERLSGPGSASNPHPTDAIPLPAHGFDTLDDLPVRDLGESPSADAISRAAVVLIRAAAETLGLTSDVEPVIELDEARRLITALAGLLAASQEHLGGHRQALRDGLTTLQRAFRQASAHPDALGQGPGEALLP